MIVNDVIIDGLLVFEAQERTLMAGNLDGYME